MNKVALLVVTLLVLTGCQYKELNQSILDANRSAKVEFAAGMKACGDNAACQVGVAAAYFSGAGQQAIVKPESALDYMKGAYPLLDLLVRWDQYGEGSGGVTFKNVTFGRDAVISGFNVTKTHTEANYNRTYTGPGTGEGVTYTQNPTP